ncbi:MAG: hypothetical protein KF739_11630 [Cryobacterium sp.]|nr:hypothetical protein [Cryobacterium sp.]
MAADLAAQASAFAKELGSTLRACLPRVPNVDAQGVGNRFVVQPTDKKGMPAHIPLLVGGNELATLNFQMYFDLDWSGTFLKNIRTDLSVFSVLDRQPLFHLDYKAEMHSAPKAHWQFHAERGSLTHLLTLAQKHRPKTVKNPHTLSRLHFPVGGERFRPCIEDVIQFLIEECGVDREKGWEKSVVAGREKWRRLQLRTVVRDLQEESAEILRREGWTVTPPDRLQSESKTTLHNW